MTTATDLQARIDAIPYWYHRIELPDGLATPGWAPLNAPSYRVPEDLSGKRVLDIGAWDGFWTFEALRRGAAEAVAIDDFSDFLGKPERVGRRSWETFDLCRDALGYDEARCRRLERSVYDVSEEELGRFDVVFFFGALYHLRHPLLALDRLSAVCDGEIRVESALLDDYSPYRGGLGHGYPDNQLVAEFYPNNELFEDPHMPDPQVRLHYGDMLDYSSLSRLVEESQPDEIYNLAAQSHVRVSFDMPEYTVQTIMNGTTNLLEAIRLSDLDIRYYQAGSSEMFGNAPERPQRESTTFHPRSPYAAAKVGAHAMTKVYREAYGLFACNGILFNHESPRRGPTFVTRKITRGIAQILCGDADALYLGNLDASRD